LAYIVARETLAPFQQVRLQIPPRMQDLPSGFIRDTRRLLQGQIEKPQTHFDFEADIEYAMALWECGNGVYSIIATYKALPGEVEREEYAYQESKYGKAWEVNFQQDESDDEWDAWEVHYWASIVAAGSPGTLNHDVAAHRAYWQR
jgi:hypothetical protein